MLKRILDNWKPKWFDGRWHVTLVALPVIIICLPLLVLALPYLDILNGMAVQAKGKAQGTYGWFSGNQELAAERPPVEGTVPQGWFPYHVTEKDEDKAAAAADASLTNPVPRTKAALKRGQAIFDRICITCHGKRAEGNGSIQGPGLFPAPPSLHAKKSLDYGDGRIWHIISRGYGKMPSYANVLDPDERWAVVHYVRALQKAMQDATKD
ncbi:MAG: cytochrome c [Planctomycetota bacterium]|nr:cytochrome c [Planctomycetota bacterium]